MNICLTLIVRDEARYIERCLKSALPFCGSVLIHDTGSQDDTVQRIWHTVETFRPEIKHCCVGVSAWKNFATNRNEAIIAARAEFEPDWFLFLDGDEELNCSDRSWPQRLDPNLAGYQIPYAGPCRWSRPMLVNAKHDWKYVGACHEYVTAPDIVTSRLPVLPGVYVNHLEDGSRSAAKLARNLELLLAEKQAEPKNPRTRFYLANTFFDLRRFAEAEIEYAERLALHGWDQENFYAAYRLAQCKEARQLDPLADYLGAYGQRPTRIEPLVRAAKHLRRSGKPAVAYLLTRQAMQHPLPDDVLFVELPAYEWDARVEHGLACVGTNRLPEAIETFAPLTGHANENVRNLATTNLRAALARLS